ncbi:hypothetical protein M2138_000367 [Dysgonomonadaceae bacterium PH5-43]|nr:hypothetical protein [Dysgonomonadaceae bacterium PH5-43]
MPIISSWMQQAEKKDIKWFLIFWIISMCLPYVQMFAPLLGYTGNFGNMGVLGVCDWNAYGMFYYFSGFLGYVVLAYYLVRFPLQWSWGKTLAVALPMLVIGYAITAGGFILTQKNFPGSYAHLEIIWYFSGINVFLMTLSMFMIMQKINITPNALLKKTASLTFGIYLCHFIIIQIGYDFIYPNIAAPAFVKILLIAVFTFLVSLLITWLLSLNKITKKVVL